jgi:Zn-dependent protease
MSSYPPSPGQPYPDEPPPLPPAPIEPGPQPPGWPSGPPPPRERGSRARGGMWGGILALLAGLLAYGKYLLVFGKFGATLFTMLISFGLYAAVFGPWFAAGLIVMIFTHEMGHVLEIRRQGMRATAPLFIPFMGAAIFQREHPNDALHQAEIGIAGPIAGTVAATAAFALYSVTHEPVLLLWAWLGFIVNLFNLIPVGMLDGGWVLAVASKWFQILGIALLLLAAWLIGAGLLIIVIILVISIPVILDRFRHDQLPYYQSVPMAARWAMGLVWLALVAYLGFGTYQIHQLLFSVLPVGQ